MATILAESKAEQVTGDADEPGGQWQPYLDQMAPYTKICVTGLVNTAVAAGSEWGRGVFGSETNLQLIADISQISDSLGTLYTNILKYARAADMKYLENPKIVEAAREKPDSVKNLLAEIKAGNKEKIGQYVEALDLYD